MKKNKKVLYNFWGYLSDRIGISAPDGNASYSSWIINEFLDRGYEVYRGPIDRDLEIINKYGLKKSFEGFAQKDRLKAYKRSIPIDINNMPEVDILLLEWRFPTPYNQCSKRSKKYNPDLEIQEKIINHYKNTNTKIVIMDLDYKLKKSDIKRVKPDLILEQAYEPKNGVFQSLPIDIKYLKNLKITTKYNKLMSYVGNDYRRREDIIKKIIPFSKKHEGMVHFYGNWTRKDKKEFTDKYTSISYHGRIGLSGFKEALGDSVCTPLLAPNTYKNRGFMTPRIFESLVFGSIPIGFDDFNHIDKFLPKECIVKTSKCSSDIEKKVLKIKSMNKEKKKKLVDKIIKKISKYFSSKRFVDRIESVLI